MKPNIALTWRVVKNTNGYVQIVRSDHTLAALFCLVPELDANIDSVHILEALVAEHNELVRLREAERGQG